MSRRANVAPGLVIVLILACLAAAPLGVSTYFAADVLARAMLFAIFALSLDLAWGYGGILSLGHSAFFGIGAYAVSFALLRWDSGAAPLVGFALAVLLPAALAAIVGWFIFYGATSILYVAIVTLSLPVLLSAIALRVPELTGGLTGLSGVPSLIWAKPLVAYYVIFAALVVAVSVVGWLVRSDFGRLLVAVRDNEQRARFLGFDTSFVRLAVFSLSGALAGFAGAIYAPYNGFVSHSLLGLGLSTSAIVWVAVGGRGTVIGPLLGAIAVNVLEPTLNDRFPGYWQLILGLLFIVVILAFPSGLYGSIGPGVTHSRSRTSVREKAAASVAAGLSIVLRKVGLAFGSLKVLRDVDMELATGSVHCLIGPNGAGKSTLVNVVTGLLRPSAGTVEVNGRNIGGSKPDRIARLGVMRTFQASNVFDTMTVADNLILAGDRLGLDMLWRRSAEIPLPPSALRVLRTSRLDTKLDVRTSELGHGERKWLELCMVLTAQPGFVFLDEPTAGLSAGDRAEAGKVLTKLVRDHGLGLLLIEHDLDFVRSIADRLTVLNHGEIVADGSVEAVAGSPLVQDIYIGRSQSTDRGDGN